MMGGANECFPMLGQSHEIVHRPLLTLVIVIPLIDIIDLYLHSVHVRLRVQLNYLVS